MATLIFTPNPKFTIHVTAEKETEMFRKLSRLQEVFGEGTCGICNSTDIRYQAYKVKTKDNGEFWNHVIHCDACEASLQFSQHKVGETLYARRDKAPKTRGWMPKSGQPAPNQKVEKTSVVTPPMVIVPKDAEWNAPQIEENVPF